MDCDVCTVAACASVLNGFVKKCMDRTRYVRGWRIRTGTEAPGLDGPDITVHVALDGEGMGPARSTAILNKLCPVLSADGSRYFSVASV